VKKENNRNEGVKNKITKNIREMRRVKRMRRIRRRRGKIRINKTEDVEMVDTKCWGSEGSVHRQTHKLRRLFKF
jgi:hypothetical protein